MNYIISGPKLRDIILTAPVVKSATAQTLQGEFSVDPGLPTVYSDTYAPNPNIAILHGRLVGVGYVGAAYTSSNTDKTTYCTLADGVSITPLGMAAEHSRKAMPSHVGAQDYRNDVTIVKNTMAEVPLLTINNQYGTMTSGDAFTAHAGLLEAAANVAAVAIPPKYVDHGIKGMPVKWIGKTVYSQSKVASTASMTLTGASYRNLIPTILEVRNAGAIVSAVQTLTWTTDHWVLSLAATPTYTDVTYTMGHAASQIAGNVVRSRPMAAVKAYDAMLKFVKSDDINFNGPLTVLYGNSKILEKTARSAVSVSSLSGQTANVSNGTTVAVVDPRSPVTIEIQGDVNINGTNTNYTGADWYTLPASDNFLQTVQSGLVGDYHTVDWISGAIRFADNLTVTAARVTFTEINTPFRQVWGSGQFGLTDGSVSGQGAGTPSALDVAGGLGVLQLWVN